MLISMVSGCNEAKNIESISYPCYAETRVVMSHTSSFVDDFIQRLTSPETSNRTEGGDGMEWNRLALEEFLFTLNRCPPTPGHNMTRQQNGC